MQIKSRRGNEKDNSNRTNETLWPVTDVPSAYNNTCVRASTVLSHCHVEPHRDRSDKAALRMQCPAPRGSKAKSFAQISSLPSLFNGPGEAAIRAIGLGDECVNDYSLGVGSSPMQVDYTHSFSVPASFSLPPLSYTPTPLSYSLFFLYWPNKCLTDDLCGILFHQIRSGNASHTVTGLSFSTLGSKLFTASSTWWTIFPVASCLCCIQSGVQFWHIGL